MGIFKEPSTLCQEGASYAYRLQKVTLMAENWT